MGGEASPLVELYSLIRKDLEAVERIFDRELLSDLDCVDSLCARVRGFRGKMLRPALLLLSGKASGELCEEHYVLAAVVEMVHMATLVHDDVLDDASERRKQGTVNSISGNEAAVLLGDYLISHAFHLCSSLSSQEASRIVGRTAGEVCEGELLQNHLRGRVDLSESDYFEVIRRKTAALTAACCELGALWSGADEEVVASLRAYGVDVGIAFQIVDDVLDISGDQAEVGKTLGRDFELGKCTLPILHSLSASSSSDAVRLTKLLGDPQPHVREQLRDFLDGTGSVDHALHVARRFVSEAIGHLECIAPGDAKDVLVSIAGFIVDRHF